MAKYNTVSELRNIWGMPLNIRGPRRCEHRDNWPTPCFDLQELHGLHVIQLRHP